MPGLSRRLILLVGGVERLQHLRACLACRQSLSHGLDLADSRALLIRKPVVSELVNRIFRRALRSLLAEPGREGKSAGSALSAGRRSGCLASERCQGRAPGRPRLPSGRAGTIGRGSAHMARSSRGTGAHRRGGNGCGFLGRGWESFARTLPFMLPPASGFLDCVGGGEVSLDDGLDYLLEHADVTPVSGCDSCKMT